MIEVEPRSAALFVAGRVQRGVVSKFGNFKLRTVTIALHKTLRIELPCIKLAELVS
jgi:hypothetical protein